MKVSDTDASGNKTGYGYVNSGGTADPYWRILSVTDPVEYEVRFTYPSGSDLMEWTHPG